ncbi:MAG: hypothetical protein HY706_07425 [Candidatus Hydrogenedentes bacterium]|nr:hypothetical protein [Candidatus Hydrogenedentota bacterium]
MNLLWYDLLASVLAPFGAAWLAVSPRHRCLLARFHPPVPTFSGPVLWVQACSVGEISVARPFLQALRSRWPDLSLLLTVSTVSGYRLASTACEGIPVTWFPFDHRVVVERFVRRARPRALVLIETELWPNVIRAAIRRRIPVLLVNGRMSDKHHKRYLQMRGFYRAMCQQLSAAGMQSDAYAERLLELGAKPTVVHVTGNIKFDGVATTVPEERRVHLRAEHGFSPDQPILIFGSTRPGDEALAARCFTSLCGAFPDLRLVIALRHPERASEVLALFGEPVLKRSDVIAGRRPQGERIHLVDTLGELVCLYSIGTVAVIGGSFSPEVQGHNPLESAALAVPTVFGPCMGNFADPARVLIEASGARQVATAEELLPALKVLLQNPDERAAMAARGRAAILGQQGAISRTLDLLEQTVPGLIENPKSKMTSSLDGGRNFMAGILSREIGRYTSRKGGRGPRADPVARGS